MLGSLYPLFGTFLNMGKDLPVCRDTTVSDHDLDALMTSSTSKDQLLIPF